MAGSEQSNSQQNLKRKLDTAGLDEKDDDRRDRCYKCGGRGHMQKECPSDPKTGNELSCYKCQGKGHFARNCPNLSRDVCYFCGGMGHHGLDCPLLTRMFGNLPPVKRKELMAKMHSNPQYANQVMREMGGGMTYGDPYSLMAGNPLQALMALLQANPAGLNAAAAQLGLGAAQYAAYGQPPPQYAAYDTQGAATYGSYGAPPSPTGATTPPSPYNAPTMYAAAPFAAPGGADVLATLRALSAAGTTAAYGGAGYGAGVGSHSGYGSSSSGSGHSSGGGSNCFKCGQTGHFARECPNAPAEGAMLCYRCGQSGHMAKDCNNAPVAGSSTVAGNESCFRCGERGHFSRDCVKNGAVPSKDSCFRCGQPGHRTRECTGSDIRVCFVCKQSGHVSSNCPDRLAH